MRRRDNSWSPLCLAAFCALLLPSVGATSTFAAPTTNTQQVVVTNTPTQAVPVTGTVNAVQSGPWSVNISNTTPMPVAGAITLQGTPAVTVSASTAGIFEQVQTLTAGGSWFYGPIDVSASKQIRVGIQSNALGFGGLTVEFITLAPTGRFFELDTVTTGDRNHLMKVYDLPGQTLFINVTNNTDQSIHSHVVVWGRPN